MFAVVTITGKQYTVKAGDVIDVDRVEGKEGETVTFDRVLLTADGKASKVGTPTVSGAVVKTKIVSQYQGKKVEVRRFKSKVRTRKQNGFRHQLTKLEVVAVG